MSGGARPRKGGESGAVSNTRAGVQGAARAPLQPPVNWITKNLKYRIWLKTYISQGNMLVWPYDAEKPP
mgnify:CR=1 FL=1